MLEETLKKSSFLVGSAVTLADICIARAPGFLFVGGEGGGRGRVWGLGFGV